MRMRIIASALVFAASPAAAGPDGHAAAAADRLSRQVGYADLDLSSRSGRAALQRRVSDAVSDLCNEAVGRDDGSSEYRFATMKCRKLAWREARPQIASFIDGVDRGATTLAAAVRVTAAPAK